MRITLFILILSLTGCGTIQIQERLSQNVGRDLSTYIGGQVFKIQRTSNLPNVFGKADIFGGKVNRGFTEVRYQGFSSDGQLVFRITEIETESTETTMSRYGRSTSTLNAQRIGNNIYGTISTYNTPHGSTGYLPPNTTEFAIDFVKTKEFTVSGTRIIILSATKTSLTYQLER